MPIYEYQCESCGHELEKIQKFSDAPLTDCPECEKPALKKLVSASSFRLKGSGWYETDFKNKNKSDSKEDAASSKAGNDSTSEKNSNKTEKSDVQASSDSKKKETKKSGTD